MQPSIGCDWLLHNDNSKEAPADERTEKSSHCSWTVRSSSTARPETISGLLLGSD